jgi:hypothetical protein
MTRQRRALAAPPSSSSLTWVLNLAGSLSVFPVNVPLRNTTDSELAARTLVRIAWCKKWYQGIAFAGVADHATFGNIIRHSPDD